MISSNARLEEFQYYCSSVFVILFKKICSITKIMLQIGCIPKSNLLFDYVDVENWAFSEDLKMISEF